MGRNYYYQIIKYLIHNLNKFLKHIVLLNLIFDNKSFSTYFCFFI
uniref:Uncharacterized protein n=1 Tax=Parastrongyloides trichosuri TaxID=131310 RepID=A0A0N4ZFQ5_PARTI